MKIFFINPFLSLSLSQKKNYLPYLLSVDRLLADCDSATDNSCVCSLEESANPPVVVDDDGRDEYEFFLA